ncbi:MAG: response regulator transcription factor [Clostridiales bacterium]|nr:response regulator transcription factor [Clostridiales bacterium]
MDSGGKFMRILIAEGDMLLMKALKTALIRSGFESDVVKNGLEAAEYLKCGNYDGAIIDDVLARLSGLEVVREARQTGVLTPIMVLSSKNSVEETVSLLDAGANDVLKKPFDMREATARLGAMTRKYDAQTASFLKIGNLTLDRRDFQLSSPNGRARLTRKEFQLIETLMSHPRMLIRTDALFDKVWGYESKVEINALWVTMSMLRKTIKSLDANVRIVTMRNVGYKIEEC